MTSATQKLPPLLMGHGPKADEQFQPRSLGMTHLKRTTFDRGANLRARVRFVIEECLLTRHATAWLDDLHNLSADFRGNYYYEEFPVILSDVATDDDIRLDISMPLILKGGALWRPTDAVEIEAAVVYEGWGYSLQKQNRLTEAISKYEQAQKIKPSSFVAKQIEVCQTNIQIAQDNEQMAAEEAANAAQIAAEKKRQEEEEAKRKAWEEARKKDD